MRNCTGPAAAAAQSRCLRDPAPARPKALGFADSGNSGRLDALAEKYANVGVFV